MDKYLVALGQLEAQRSLDRIAVVAAGSGTMEERDQRSYLRSLKLAASGGRQTGVQKATAASLARLGIAVETLPPPEETKKPVRKRAVKKGGGEVTRRVRAAGKGGARARRGPRAPRPGPSQG